MPRMNGGGGIRLSGHIDVPQDRQAAVMAALPAHVAQTCAEAGCLEFTVTPCGAVPGRLLVSERFASRAALGTHRERTRRSAWFEITRGLERHYIVST